MSNNNKKILAEKLKKTLNSPEYVDMPDLISGDYHGYFFTFDLKSKGNDGWIQDMRKGGLKKVEKSQLEPNDWEEIVNLIEKRNKEKEKIWETKRKNIEQKLNQQSNLYYYWGKSDLRKNERADSWNSDKDMRGFCYFLGGNGNELTHHLYIAENHPVLDNFSFQTGFYLIDNDKKVEKLVGNYEGDFGCSGGETNPCNWRKYIEVNDQITITPYEVENNNESPENLEKELTTKGRSGCDTCHKKLGKDWGGSDNFYIIKRYHGKVNIGGPVIWACLDCYSTKEQEYLQNYETVWERYLDKNNEIDYHQIKFSFIDCYAGHKDQNGKILKQKNCPHCQPWKNHKTDNRTGKISGKEKIKVINSLIQYFQGNDIKKISFKNGELVITHNNNNNEIITNNQLTNNSEYQTLKNNLEGIGKNELTFQELLGINSKVSTENDNTLSGNKYYWLGGGIIAGIVVSGILVLVWRKKKDKNK